MKAVLLASLRCTPKTGAFPARSPQAVPVVGRWKDLEGFHHSQTVLVKAREWAFFSGMGEASCLVSLPQKVKLRKGTPM